MQGWYYVESLTGQRHDRVQTERIPVLTSFGDIGKKKNEVAGELFLSRNLLKSSFGIGRLLSMVGPVFIILFLYFHFHLTNMNTKYSKN